MSLYEPLHRHLSKQTAELVSMSFPEIEQLIGQPLPATARGRHARQWWANSDSHVQAKAWLKAHRKAKLDISRSQVVFRRVVRSRGHDLMRTQAAPDRLQLDKDALQPAALRMIEDMAEETGVSLDQAATAMLNQIALRRRRETLDWFAQNTIPSSLTSAALIREDRDGR